MYWVVAVFHLQPEGAWCWAPAIGSQNPNDYPVGAWESK